MILSSLPQMQSIDHIQKSTTEWMVSSSLESDALKDFYGPKSEEMTRGRFVTCNRLRRIRAIGIRLAQSV